MPDRGDGVLDAADKSVSELELETSYLPIIQQALAGTRWLPPIPRLLRTHYGAAQSTDRRSHNRRVLLIMTIIFDLFIFAQFKTAPEIARLSALLRFCVFSPAVFAFILLDANKRLGKLYSPYLTLLAFLPTVLSTPLILLTNPTNLNALSDIRATPLILLATGVVARLTPLEALINVAVSAGSFIATVLLARCIPMVQDASLILSEIGVGAAALTFTLQLEIRDRRVFLLQINAAIHRASLAARNRGLLAETQTDGLTGVANRRCFDATLAQAWRQACETGGELGLIIMDIDHFKLFNDFYGHQGGDDCLRLAASTARRETRGNDLFARYGGEEFAAILPGANLDTAVAIAERIRTAIAGLGLPHGGLGTGATLTISLGAASLAPSREDDPRRLIELADANLYAAKRAGRNRVCCHPDEPGMATHAHPHAGPHA